MTQRSACPAVLDRATLYRRLSALQPGDAVPPDLYVSDYRDGEIPDWRIHSRQEADGGLLLLVAFDMSNAYLPGGAPADAAVVQWRLFGDNKTRYPAVRIVSSPAKTLRSPIVEFSGDDAWPPMLCDMLQQAKIAMRAKARARVRGSGSEVEP